MRDLLYVPPGRSEVERDRALRARVLEPGLRRARRGDGDARRPSGLATILCNTHGSAGRERDYVRMLLERGVEGMVFISAEITDVRGRHAHYAKLLERGARLVFVNGGSEDLDVTSVGVDERIAGRIATEHLIELGHERIGFVAGDEYALPTREKRSGTWTHCARRGFRTASSRTRRSRWAAGARLCASCSRSRTKSGRPR